MSRLLNKELETNGAELDEMYEIMHCITVLASSTIKAMIQSGKDGNNNKEDLVVPQSLQEIAIILHGILPTLTQYESKLKDELSHLFELCWINQIPGREELMANTIIYLLSKSTHAKSTQSDVSRVYGVHQVLSAVDLCSENASVLSALLLQCIYHPQFVTSSVGIKFLSFLFTLNLEFTEKLHQSIKNHLPNTPRTWHPKFGEIYFRAWQRTSDLFREKIEVYCIQDLMYRTVHSQRGHNSPIFNTLFKVLSFIHKEKTQRGVEAMLTKLYEPILWRSLLVTNSDVRANAAALMFDVFPLQDPALHNEQADTALQRQFDLMHSLLADPVAEIRLIAVKGVGQVLKIYWELIPAQVIQCLITTLVQDLAYDCSSPLIREAVIKVLLHLCDNHLCIPLLKTILPELGNFVHDVSEKVRIAMFDILLKIKGLRAIKFWNVVSLEHILSRLETDTAPVVKRIMKLIGPSFLPVDCTPAEQVERCITLIKTNQGAARQFFMHVSQFFSLEDVVKYIVILCRYILESARQIKGTNSASRNEENENINDKEEATSNKKAKKDTRSKSTNKCKESEKDKDSSTEDASLESNDSQVFCGMVEAIYLMFISISEEISSAENQQMKESLAKKLSVTVRELMAVSQDPDLDTALIALAGHLPPKALPLVSQNLLNRLRRGCQSGKMLDTASIIKTLVLWGKTDCVIELIKESLENTLNVNQDDLNKNFKKPKKKRTVTFTAEEDSVIALDLAMDLILKLMSQADCRLLLLSKHRAGLYLLLDSMSPVTQKLQSFLTSATVVECEVAGLVKLYATYLRLAAFTCTHTQQDNLNLSDNQMDDENNVNGGIKAMQLAVSWTNSCVVPILHVNTTQEKQNYCIQTIEYTLKVCRGLLMIGGCEGPLLDEVILLCKTLLQSPLSFVTLTSDSLACVYQFCLFRKQEVQESLNGSVHLCVSQFLNSLSKSLTEENSEEFQALGQLSETFASWSCTIIDIILELVRQGRFMSSVDKVMASILSSTLIETAWMSKNKNTDKKPGFTRFLIPLFKKRIPIKKMFLKHFQEYCSTDISDIDQLSIVVNIIALLESGDVETLRRSIENIQSAGLDKDANDEALRELKQNIEGVISKL
ncbi:condensin-2 complex subunit G2-like isoform X2 [Physella acuta]|nr:condensin-2 complex subunit G2-like isoform X2 [Physella acuta]XP_059170021.1 condensin-2 complex subunit G2-like isoform X2 [Physella acuta]